MTGRETEQRILAAIDRGEGLFHLGNSPRFRTQAIDMWFRVMQSLGYFREVIRETMPPDQCGYERPFRIFVPGPLTEKGRDRVVELMQQSWAKQEAIR